jgi:hypothetical protein
VETAQVRLTVPVKPPPGAMVIDVVLPDVDPAPICMFPALESESSETGAPMVNSSADSADSAGVPVEVPSTCSEYQPGLVFTEVATVIRTETGLDPERVTEDGTSQLSELPVAMSKSWAA